MDEKEIKLEMRLYAMELFIANLMAIGIVSSGENPAGVLQEMRNQMVQGARKLTFPGYEATESDLLSGELEVAVDKIWEMAGAQVNAVLRHQQR